MKRDMKKPKQSELQELKADKKGDIDQNLFSFLENLLIFRTLEELTVPRESSVKFRITREKAEQGICLLIHIDNQAYPIFEAQESRPDYLAIYLHGDGCICTIIEMKSRAGKNLKHGLEQISVLADKLKQEFKRCLPRKFKLHIQGILLSQFNSEVPNELIIRMAQEGLTILSVQYSHRAELFPYISQKNIVISQKDTPRTKFVNIPRHPCRQNPIEQMMSCMSLRKRLTEPQTAAEKNFCISYVLSNKYEFATLTVKKDRCVFLVTEEGTTHSELIKQDIEANGLQDKFEVVLVENKSGTI